MSTKPIKGFNTFIYFKNGNPCLAIESITNTPEKLEQIEAVYQKIKDWFSK